MHSEVAVAEHVVDRPGFDEYVVARGGDLLRTAWLLVGEEQASYRLVRTALARAWPQWSHLAEHGAGSYDTDLRRFLVQAHLRRHHHGAGPDVGGRKSSAPQRDPLTDNEKDPHLHALGPLDALSRVERTILVLVLFDGLGVGQVADLLDDDVGPVRHHLRHALAVLNDRFGLDERGVRGLLESLAPDDPPVDLLLSAEVAPSARRRGAWGWLFAVGAVAVTALVVSLVPGPPGQVPGPAPAPRPTARLVPSALSCRSSPGSPAPPRPVEPPLSASFVAALVCARTDDDSVWSGPLAPDDPVTDALALDSLVLEPRGAGSACPDLPHGPAFRLLLLGRDGTTTTWANEGLACDGWPALAQVYVATAEQAARSDPGDGDFLGCPTALGRTVDPTGTGPGLRRGTVLVSATACLHPLAPARPSAIPRFRQVRGNVLGLPDLAHLNEELARAGSRRTAKGDCGQGPAYRTVIRARTETGRVLELSSTCGQEFSVDGHLRDSWRADPETRSMLRALLNAN
ncbi:hypothetical protein GCM10009867_22620 [Pedococcus aerophilus]|uniref:RNA polymerase sigma factor 70 region 4 type 2 domain-containing protein n=1 Tax=Pedococcus aerophilus TaxID=436356 RepID=A0ABP6H4V3_9MICO